MLDFYDLYDFIKSETRMREKFGFITSAPYRGGTETQAAVITPEKFAHFVNNVENVDIYKYAIGERMNFICYYKILPNFPDFWLAVGFYGKDQDFDPVAELKRLQEVEQNGQGSL